MFSFSPLHALLNAVYFRRYFHRLYVEEYRFVGILLISRQERVNLYSTLPVDEERVRPLFQMKVDDLAEKRLHFQIGAGDSLELADGKHRQAFRNYQPCQHKTSSEHIEN